MTRVETILGIARKYMGMAERTPNLGFKDEAFEKKMRQVGFYTGAPWCAFLVKLIYGEAYYDNKMLHQVVAACCSGNAQDTFRNFKKDGTFQTGQEPRPGAIVIWQLGSGKSGHAGVVEKVEKAKNTMYCFEGNTNGFGSREGDRSALKPRTIDRPFQAAGLNIVGYIYAFEI